MMLYRLLVILHLIGASTWIGGHVVLVRVILPAARRANDAGPVREFERSFGRIGMASLLVQAITGAWLVSISPFIGGWGSMFREPTAATHLALAKLLMLVIILAMAGHASHRILPRLSAETLGRLARHAWIVTVLSILMLACGAGIRLGGLFT